MIVFLGAQKGLAFVCMSEPCFRHHLRRVVEQVASQLGAGHSEAVYSKACSAQLQSEGVLHQCEHHTPVVYWPDVSPSFGAPFHISDERIDILAYEPGNESRVHVLELKAVAARVSPRQPVTGQTAVPAAHVQLLKYVRNLQRSDPSLGLRVAEGHVVNFRQSVTFADPEMRVEFDTLDVKGEVWLWNDEKRLEWEEGKRE